MYRVVPLFTFITYISLIVVTFLFQNVTIVCFMLAVIKLYYFKNPMPATPSPINHV